MISPLEQLPNTYRPFFGRFSNLTTAQKTLIQPILDGRDVILQAGTGLGKTEAILAPATERLMTSPGSFTILYIVPTRALALDMHRRINPIFKQLGLKSGLRTGDSKTLKNGKPHLLILTPESLDVLLGSRNSDNKYFLKHVRIMIIDEVHIFLLNDRGYQLSHLRRRLEIQSIGALQTLALSATISNLEEIASFFKLKNVFYYQQPALRKLQPYWVHIEDENRELVPFFDDLSLRWKCKKLLVFVNSRRRCEQLFDLLNQGGVFSQNILLHYSNLSCKERRSIESSFRNNKKSVCIATSTLEMGIDIGDVDGVILIGPPSSTMTFLQKIGRGNRRQQSINFWGITSGSNAGHQLIRFLALFELAKENQIEKIHVMDNYTVLFQQILSCLYAKRIVSQNSLNLLFKEKEEDCCLIFHEMVTKNWLKPMSQPGLFFGGWRYMMALRQQKIWSNFPPTDEEYDVILEQEKIAVLPLSSVRQLEIGDCIQLTGKVLKVLQIEEKRAFREVWVEETNASINKELVWIGFGIPISFEVAQKMGTILLEKKEPEGLLNRSRRLLQEERERIESAVCLPNGIRVHRLGGGSYRYETFLGSTGNFILYQIIKTQLTSRIEGLTLNFDELGIESNEWIPFESLEFPYSISLFQKWVSSHLPLLRGAFSWNCWIQSLPENLQQKEITSRLLDPRVLKHFEQYHKESKPLAPIEFQIDHKQVITNQILVKGEPWSLENEKEEWGTISFPELPSESPHLDLSLTATQMQGYVTQKLCPRWARFQHLNYIVESHSRFQNSNQEKLFRQQQGIAFKKQIIQELASKKSVLWETGKFTWKDAIKEVITSQKSLFLVQAKLQLDGHFKGSPDLIYLKSEGSHICLEIWDIKNGSTFTYAQKWRIAFYAYLLECLLKKESFSLPIKVSDLGGLVYHHLDKKKLFERTPFLLAHYRKWMPRLIAQWKRDSMQSSAAQNYSMDCNCISCHYFSYCYQETLFKNPHPIQTQTILSLGIESNDFPKNSKHWYFIHYDKEGIRWQCWENKESISEKCIRLEDYANWREYQEEVAKLLQKEWLGSIEQGKNPHFLVYEPTDWHFFQNAFQSTSLQALWSMHSSYTSIQSILEKHFLWPISGRLTATQVARCIGVISNPPRPHSLFHRESPLEISLDLYKNIWNWCLSQVKSRRSLIFASNKKPSVPLINFYLETHHREQECRTHEILEFQKNPFPIRVENFRSIGPLELISDAMNGKQKYFFFSFDAVSTISKFRVGDFLKLSPLGSSRIQEGFSVILESYSPEKKTLSLRFLSQKVTLLNKKQLYALDEDATDWNAPKIERVLNLLKDPKYRPELIQILLGHVKNFSSSTPHWVEQWYHSRAREAGLNLRQKEALMLPFSKNIGLIEGPPGTGKTHLLVWTLIALVAHAKFLSRPIKILVTAQTHQAIDQILMKVSAILPSANIDPVSLWKCGHCDQALFAKLGINPLKGHQQLYQNSSLIVGSTGFGIYQLLERLNFPQLFDWVIFDESSQVLPSYALLSLIFCKGNALFYGDTQQLPPILKGHYDHTSLAPCSILQDLISLSGPENRVRLNETYRMNEDICRFAGQHWYENDLYPSALKKNQKLKLPCYPLFHDLLDNYLDPSKSMVVVELDHQGCHQSSEIEALWIARAVKRLIKDYSFPVEEIGIISPHRLQNNTISCALKEVLPSASRMPKIDTVERMQGLEFDIVIFSATVSEREVIHSTFLKDYRRFNVALTRSRKKFIFVASPLFFQSFPMTEKELIAHFPFENFFSLYSHQDKSNQNT